MFMIIVITIYVLYDSSKRILSKHAICGNLKYLFWITRTTTMAFCTTFYVVSIVTTLNLCKFLVDGGGTIDRNAT